MMRDGNWSLFGTLGRRVTAASLIVVVWAQYVAILLGISEMGRAHRLSPIVWLLPVIYPMPWIMGVAFKRQIRIKAAQGLIDEEAANFCSGWTTILLIVAYVAIMGFSQLHTAN